MLSSSTGKAPKPWEGVGRGVNDDVVATRGGAVLAKSTDRKQQRSRRRVYGSRRVCSMHRRKAGAPGEAGRGGTGRPGGAARDVLVGGGHAGVGGSGGERR